MHCSTRKFACLLGMFVGGPGTKRNVSVLGWFAVLGCTILAALKDANTSSGLQARRDCSI